MKITIKRTTLWGYMFVVLGAQRSNQQIEVSGKGELQVVISRFQGLICDRHPTSWPKGLLATIGGGGEKPP